MGTKIRFIILLGLFGISSLMYAQHRSSMVYMMDRFVNTLDTNGDTMLVVDLKPFIVFPPMKFTSKAQEKFYWKTIRDVKKTLPLAKTVGRTLNLANAELNKMSSKKDKERFLDALEDAVKERYEPDIRKLTISQGKMLLRLIDRETNMTSYELLKMYRGSFQAFMWQSVAKVFGADLKTDYDGSDRDKIIERVIILVEAGQL